jgi:hypothetical protein
VACFSPSDAHTTTGPDSAENTLSPARFFAATRKS